MSYLFFLMYYICTNTITNIHIVLTTYFFSYVCTCTYVCTIHITTYKKSYSNKYEEIVTKLVFKVRTNQIQRSLTHVWKIFSLNKAEGSETSSYCRSHGLQIFIFLFLSCFFGLFALVSIPIGLIADFAHDPD